MAALLELLGTIATLILSSSKDVTEEDVKENIAFLSKYDWFQLILEKTEFKQLIENDPDVRHIIGKFAPYKMERTYYYNRHYKKIHKKLEEKTGVKP